jgi:hypothetical protein
LPATICSFSFIQIKFSKTFLFLTEQLKRFPWLLSAAWARHQNQLLLGRLLKFEKSSAEKVSKEIQFEQPR